MAKGRWFKIIPYKLNNKAFISLLYLRNLLSLLYKLRDILNLN